MAAAKFHLPTIRTQTPHYQPLGSGNILVSLLHRESGNIDWTHLQIARLYNLLQSFDVLSAAQGHYPLSDIMLHNHYRKNTCIAVQGCNHVPHDREE